jgi:outer membrane protein OmpA-like peptidoglycan-associated protein
VRVCIVLVLALLLLPAISRAQVYVNQAALDQLAGVKPPASVAASPLPARHVVYRARARRAASRPLPVQAASAAAVAPKGVTPPPAVVVVPAVAKPVVPVRPSYTGPVTIGFAPGSATLPAGTAARLAGVCGVPGQVTVDARAADDPGDPSAALRLSLARALAVKAALTGCGVPATRVLPRALGDVAGADENVATVGAMGK